MLEFVERDYPHPYPPKMSEFTRTFWVGLEQGRFLTTRGVVTGRYAFPPKPVSPCDWSEAIAWVELSGRGLLYSYTTMHAVPTAFQAEAPYRVCIVDLEEGVRLVTRLLGTEPVPLDHPIRLVAVRYSDCVSYAAKAVTG